MSEKPSIPRVVTKEEIEAGKTPKGAWTRATLEGWGVPWPPPKGWRQAIMAGRSVEPPKPREPAPDSLEAGLLHDVIVAVISAGQGHILNEVEGMHDHLGSRLPTVAEVIGHIPARYEIKGEISFDDKVYRFWCMQPAAA